MPKIPVDIDNLATLKHEATRFCDLAKKLFGGESINNLTTGKLLTAVSKRLGYSSYGGMVACNKQAHLYLPISLSDITHFRHLATSIAEETGISETVLLVIASFLQLGAESINHIRFGRLESGTHEAFTCLTVGEIDKSSNLTLALSTPKALVAGRVATTLKNMAHWLPELVAFLKQEMKAHDDCVILTPNNRLWEVSNLYEGPYRPFGYLEFVVTDPHLNTTRQVYCTISSELGRVTSSDVYDIVAEDCFDLDKILGMDIDDAIYPDEATIPDPRNWCLAFFTRLCAAALVVEVRMKVDPEKADPELFEDQNLQMADEQVMQFLHRNERVWPPCQGGVIEMRQVSNQPYLEPWVQPEVTRQLLKLNDQILKEQQQLYDELNKLEGQMARYWIQIAS
ncbi:TPA: hypothetical protein NGU10_000890 [Vibrio parahaemolyticus]|uniref:hypothetical protein n=1 Tax=Vibrio parahaemolyticus TaxID=670 RepID=UPI0011221536|nr:hypothetical protein [Vibrio parahaemolyticus]TOC34045.1 hypothetical protein CGJ88_22435 [Vibrio parahaemolyticus]HCE2428476.1 hypothetical protein [Vibrio parahaemolyticus]HCE2485913.1 hypothetical protein [Vibrio parahaemolyticus]